MIDTNRQKMCHKLILRFVSFLVCHKVIIEPVSGNSKPTKKQRFGQKAAETLRSGGLCVKAEFVIFVLKTNS